MIGRQIVQEKPEQDQRNGKDRDHYQSTNKTLFRASANELPGPFAAF
jgi:hypothetical protein